MNLDGTEVNLPEGEDQALQALHSVDPAIGMAQPDLVAIREKVDTSELAEVSSLSEHVARTTRFPRWSYAAAAAVLLVGVGGGTGYAIAAKSYTPLGKPSLGAYCGEQDAYCNDSGLSGQTSAMCAEFAPNCNDTPGTLEGTSSNYAAGKTADLGASVSSSWIGRTWLTPADALSDTPGSGQAYVLSSEDLDRGAAVKNLIDAFSIGSHKIRHQSAQDGTRVIENDTRATIDLAAQDGSLVYWYYDNPDNGQYACEEGYGERARTDSSGPCKVKTGKAVSDTEAIALAKEIFGTAGLDLANVTWETNYFGTNVNKKLQPYVQVVARMTIDGHELEGQDTVLQWTIELAPDKSVVHAFGILYKAVQVPDYEIIGAKTAVLRSQDPKWSMAYGPQPIYSSDQGVVEGIGYPGRVVTYGTKLNQNLDDQGRPLLQVDLDQVEITKAEPGLGGFYLPDNRYVILPVYKLTGGGRTWTQLSVADKYLQVR